MNAFAKLKVSQKLLAAFSMCIVLIIMLSVLSVVWLREISQMQQAMYATEVVPLKLTGDAAWQAATHFRRMYPFMLKTDDKSRAETLGLNEKSAAEVTKAIDFERSHATSAEQHQLIADFDATWPAYLASTKRVEAAAQTGDNAAAMAELNARTDPLHVRVRKLFISLGEMRERSAQARAQEGTAIVNAAALKLLALAALGLTAASVLCWWVTRFIVRQIGGEPVDAVALAHSVALGDLTVDVKLRAGDANSLMAQLKAMRDSLSQVVSRVRLNSESVALSSKEISQGNNDLSARTEQQASALEQTAASMEELSSAVMHNAESARTANRLAVSASEVAGQGGEVVSHVIGTMKGIQDSSKRIADIIAVIDGIAFRTNILALNAAVEAARAGEQGRGFAVVAAEVRGLASRSAEAAKEIRQLIQNSVERVEQGNALVDRAGAKMAEVVASIKQVTDIMGEISSASTEQSAGVSQVSDAVSQMDQATQQNAALVEESAAAAESLSRQAQELLNAVGVFKLKSYSI